MNVLKEIAGNAYLLSQANRLKVLAYIEELLRQPQVDETVRETEPVETTATTASVSLTTGGAGGTFFEEKYIPKKTKSGTKLYGPYRYEYTVQNGKKKFVKYHGKAGKGTK